MVQSADDPVIAWPARRHRVPDEDITHAFRERLRSLEADDEGMVMIVGPARDGALLEVGYVIEDDGTEIVLHAMPVRDKYIPRKPGRRRNR